MRILLLTFLVSANAIAAESISETYWSTYACGGYIYHFDTDAGNYRIYTKLEVKEDGEIYDSYQLTEGEIKLDGNKIYSLHSKDLTGVTTIDFSQTDIAVMKSEIYGMANLIQCDTAEAKKLIEAAKIHFKKCPKNVINCKNL